jgi:hypothetical protein
MVFALSSSGAWGASGAPQTGPTTDAAPVSSEVLSLQGFAAQNRLCQEWGDGCSVCRRDDKDAGRCSTPGIACEPGPIVCRQGR